MKKPPTEHCKLLTVSTKIFYDSIGSVHCPILKEDVFFTSDGFHHLNYNSDGTARNVAERIYKMALFPLAIPVIKNAIAITEERKIKIRMSRKKNTKYKEGKTHALVAMVGKRKPSEVKVILLRIGNGKLKFRSVMKN
jgi:hypothetical protein